ncbi:MAG TPA: ROK family protein [Blastocatellia bacterium]|nr:ROK family protein [Blastocatellia bacterium]
MGSYLLGIDLGGTKISAAVFDEGNNIIARARAKTRAKRDEENVFETIVKTGKEAVASAGLGPKDLLALGIGSPGPIDPDTGYIVDSVNIRFKNFPLGPRLSEEFGCPASVNNDVSAGTYGEFKAGAARGASHVLGIFVGTGIGGGLILNGSLYQGFSKNAGEVGHIIIKAGGPRCGCGNRGCLEALASRTAMTRRIKKAIRSGHKTLIRKLVDKKADVIPSSVLKEAYDAGDRVVMKVVNQAAHHIGVGIGSLVNLLGPEVVVLGGGVIHALGEEMMETIETITREVTFEITAKDLRITRAELGDDAGVTGAALLARESLRLVTSDAK